MQVFVDVTAEVQARIQRGFLCSTYNGHIHTAEARLPSRRDILSILRQSFIALPVIGHTPSNPDDADNHSILAFLGLLNGPQCDRVWCGR